MGPKKSMPVLRDITQTTRLLMSDAAEQMALEIADKDANGYLRVLPGNEILVMALNEVAAERGRGFYYYLPFREAWKKHDSVELLPVSRRPTTPGSRYPDVLYTHFIWSEADRERFTQDTHRARYLKCNALISPPPGETPLHAVQYIGYSSCPTYTTVTNSLVIFATKIPAPTYYLCTTEQLEGILKFWNKRWPAEGPDPEARLNQPPQLWKRQAGTAPLELHQMDHFKVASPQGIYNEITRRCAPIIGDIPPTFTASELRDIIPRPQQPENGVKLGASTTQTSTVQQAQSDA